MTCLLQVVSKANIEGEHRFLPGTKWRSLLNPFYSFKASNPWTVAWHGICQDVHEQVRYCVQPTCTACSKQPPHNNMR